MKRIVLTTLVAVTGLAGRVALANCPEPTAAITIPSGSSASRDDMLAAQRAVKAYDNAVRAYSACLEQAGDSSDKGEEAVAKLQKIAGQFNDELKAFKKRNGA